MAECDSHQEPVKPAACTSNASVHFKAEKIFESYLWDRSLPGQALFCSIHLYIYIAMMGLCGLEAKVKCNSASKTDTGQEFSDIWKLLFSSSSEEIFLSASCLQFLLFLPPFLFERDGSCQSLLWGKGHQLLPKSCALKPKKRDPGKCLFFARKWPRKSSFLAFAPTLKKHSSPEKAKPNTRCTNAEFVCHNKKSSKIVSMLFLILILMNYFIT